MTPAKEHHPSGGEFVDHAARDAIRLAHRALERFPQLVVKHKFIAGGAAVSSSLVVLAGVAIARRMRAGQSGEEAVASVTEDELQGRLVDDDDDDDEEDETDGGHDRHSKRRHRRHRARRATPSPAEQS